MRDITPFSVRHSSLKTILSRASLSVVLVTGREEEQVLEFDLPASIKTILLNGLKNNILDGLTCPLSPDKTLRAWRLPESGGEVFDQMAIGRTIADQLFSLHSPPETVSLLFSDRLSSEQVQNILMGVLRRPPSPGKTSSRVDLLLSSQDARISATGLRDLLIRANAINLATKWVNMPPSEKKPEVLAEKIIKSCDKRKIRYKLWKKPDLKKRNCSGIIAVGAGSPNPPCMLRLEYRPKIAKSSVHLVGKGVTFDSGGLSLKSAAGMEDMKSDMAGAAAVAATTIAAATLKLPVRIVSLLPLCENLPSQNPLKPGDIITFANKKTVEVLNTDAEGRLILADALNLCSSENAQTVIDLATLTGACMVALGHHYAGLFSNNDTLARSLLQAGMSSGERLWRMPLDRIYSDQIKDKKSGVIRNKADSRYGGAITAALFLEEFVQGFAWAHLDIAGPAYYHNKRSPENLQQGTGYGVSLLLNFLSSL